MGKLDARQRLTVVRKLWGQDSMGPSGVLLQSIARTTFPISPPPMSQASGRASCPQSRCPGKNLDTSVRSYSLSGCDTKVSAFCKSVPLERAMAFCLFIQIRGLACSIDVHAASRSHTLLTCANGSNTEVFIVAWLPFFPDGRGGSSLSSAKLPKARRKTRWSLCKINSSRPLQA